MAREKRWQTIIINDRCFELDTKEMVKNPIIFHKSVYDVYGRCSDTKKAIWEDWRIWFYECNSHMFGVTAHNCNFFTISGCLTWLDENDKPVEYFVVITAHHKRAWRVKRDV